MRIMEANKDLIIFENPLFFFHHNMRDAPFRFTRKNGVDFVNDKKVAFWHMQGAFTEYLKKVYISKILLGMPFKVDNHLGRSDNGSICNTYNDIIYGRPFQSLFKTRNYSRKEICRIFFDKYDLSKVFDGRTFWCKPEDQISSNAVMMRFKNCN
jgi:hypothetical protein